MTLCVTADRRVVFHRREQRQTRDYKLWPVADMCSCTRFSQPAGHLTVNGQLVHPDTAKHTHCIPKTEQLIGHEAVHYTGRTVRA